MNNLAFLGLIISLIMFSCAEEVKSPIEGTWQLVSGEWGSIEETFPDQITGSDIKVWTEDCFAFVGKFQRDTVMIDNFGWGKYRFIEGIKYEENIMMHKYTPDLEGQTMKMLTEIRNDTLIQKWPVDDNWNLAKNHSTEKYVRVK